MARRDYLAGFRGTRLMKLRQKLLETTRTVFGEIFAWLQYVWIR
jgi:hypothetical protein